MLVGFCFHFVLFLSDQRVGRVRSMMRKEFLSRSHWFFKLNSSLLSYEPMKWLGIFQEEAGSSMYLGICMFCFCCIGVPWDQEPAHGCGPEWVPVFLCNTHHRRWFMSQWQHDDGVWKRRLLKNPCIYCGRRRHMPAAASVLRPETIQQNKRETDILRLGDRYLCLLSHPDAFFFLFFLINYNLFTNFVNYNSSLL